MRSRRPLSSQNDAGAPTTKPGGTGTPAQVSSPRFARLTPAYGTSWRESSANVRMRRRGWTWAVWTGLTGLQLRRTRSEPAAGACAASHATRCAPGRARAARPVVLAQRGLGFGDAVGELGLAQQRERVVAVALEARPADADHLEEPLVLGQPEQAHERARLVLIEREPDAFLHPEPGTAAADHRVSGLVPAAILACLAIVHRDCAPGGSRCSPEAWVCSR
jgi:hypothetical protein